MRRQRSGWDDVEEHREEVKRRPGEHEQVPDGEAVGKSAPAVERDAAGVGDPSEDQQEQPFIRAQLGGSPGCEGAILVMPLYIRGICPYGTAIATRVAISGSCTLFCIAPAL